MLTLKHQNKNTRRSPTKIKQNIPRCFGVVNGLKRASALAYCVENAKRAGVHPMAALGINASSFSPVSTSIPPSPDHGSFLSALGQNLDREALVAKDQKIRQDAEAFTGQINNLKFEKMGLENDILREELATSRARRANGTLVPPAAPPVIPRAVSPLGSPHHSNDSKVAGSFGDNVYNLFSLARHGYTLMIVENPDIADGIAKSMIVSATAKVVREFVRNT